jgi:iron complex outermembrane receptor protein
MNTKNLLFVLAVSGSFADAATVKGTISDNGSPLSGVEIVIPTEEKSTISDETGNFTFENLEYGKYLVDIKGSRESHYNININFQENQPVVIELSNLDYEEIVVTANPLEHNVLKMTTPATILSEEQLIMDRSLSMEQTLNKVTGVNSGSFGAGSGQIVIRGQQGPRVSVLSNNIALQDAATVSPDHWISSEALLAKQVEVLKGPATLLYGGGAVGGVVNVLDEIIATTDFDGINGGVEFRASDSTMKERAGVLSLNSALSENLMSHFSYFDLSTGDYQIPSNAESEILHEAEGHEEEMDKEFSGVLENTSVRADGYNVGFSLFNDNGYWGISYSDLNRNYGIPGHAHEHEEEGDDHEGGDEHDEEVVRIDMQKSILNIKGKHDFSQSEFFKSLKTHYSDTDYQHAELEGEEIGTVFSNEAQELRMELTHGSLADLSGVFGFQYSNRDFSALGDEAFIIPSQTKNYSIFAIEEREFDNWHGEFGLRYDKQEIKTEIQSTIKEDALSASLGATFNLTDNWTFPVNLTSAQRLPTAEELFSNQSGASELIPHLATNTIEIGNPDLKAETANNFDIGLRYRNNDFAFNLALFYNRIDDYIFLQETGDGVEEVPVFIYQQQKATFKGFEADVSYKHNDNYGNNWSYRLFTDKTLAKLNDGSNVPRIPPARIGGEIGMLRGDWAFNLDYTHAMSQHKLVEYELPTESYDDLNLTINRVFEGERFSSLAFVKVQNLLDNEIREHASFIKDIAPKPGRSIIAGLRMTF